MSFLCFPCFRLLSGLAPLSHTLITSGSWKVSGSVFSVMLNHMFWVSSNDSYHKLVLHSFRMQTDTWESRSAVEIQQLKEEHDWTCSCSRNRNKILGCTETESSRTNIFISLTIPLYLKNHSWWMILLHLRNLLIFLSRRIEITFNFKKTYILEKKILINIPKLGKNYLAYYSSQISVKISEFMIFQFKLIQHFN